MEGEQVQEGEPPRGRRDKMRQVLKERSSMVLKAMRPQPKELVLDKNMTFNTKDSRKRLEKLPTGNLNEP